MSANALREPTRSRNFNAYLPIVILLAARLALGSVYSLVVPIWEAYDEDGHFAYVRYIATHRTLLNPLDPEAQKVWEKFQPPLYYVLAAPLIAGFDLGPTWQGPQLNPYFADGNAGANYALHPDQLSWAEQQIEMAVRVVRLFSVVVSTASVIFVYLSACLLWPFDRNKRWAAACLYAFWPQFLFNGSMVTNDALVGALAAPLLYLTLRLMLKQFRRRDIVLLGVTLGAALITKLNAVAFLPAIVLALGWSLRKTSSMSPRRWLALAGAGLCIVAALWLVSSSRFTTRQVLRVGTVMSFLSNLTLQVDLFHTLAYSLRTFAGSFGWGNLETYAWLYPLWSLLAGLALLGLVWGLLRRRGSVKGRALALLGLQVVSFVGISLALSIADRTIHLTHGRYLLPALPAVVFLLVDGWQALLPRRIQAPGWKVVSLGILLLGWSIPFETLAPVYSKPPPASAAQIQSIQPVGAVLGDQIELLGYLPTQPGTVGQQVETVLCWQALRPISINYSVLVDIVGPDGQGYGGLTTYPGRGNYATSSWALNTPFCDHYVIPVGSGFPAPAIARIHVGLLDAQHNQWLPLTQFGGQPYAAQPAQPVTGTVRPPNSDPLFVPAKIGPATQPALTAAHPEEYHFGQELILRGYDAEPLSGGKPGVKIVLYWKALKNITENYVVFVHLRDTPQHAYAQGDSEPRAGAYPTQWWEAGETVLDEHAIVLPEGTAPPLDLYVGVYDPVTGARLPVADAQGSPVANDEVVLAQNLALP